MPSKGIVWNPFEPVIERGIPTPSSNWVRFPWRKMEVGDSFFVRDAEVSQLQARKDAQKANEYTGFFFITKHIRHETTGEPGTRIWRVTEHPCTRFEVEKGIPHAIPQYLPKLDVDWGSMEVGDYIKIPYTVFYRGSTRLPTLIAKAADQHGYRLDLSQEQGNHVVTRTA